MQLKLFQKAERRKLATRLQKTAANFLVLFWLLLEKEIFSFQSFAT